MEALQSLSLLGLELPSPAYLFGAIVFGILGLAAVRYGRKNHLRITTWLGVALMVYPYAVSGTGMLYAVGIAGCAGIYAAARSGR